MKPRQLPLPISSKDSELETNEVLSFSQQSSWLKLGTTKKTNMQDTLNKALEALKAHFSNSPHHTHVFMEGDGYQSLYGLACKSLEAMFSTPENQVRLSVYIASNGESKAVQGILNQGKALILQGLLAIVKA